MKTPYKPTSIPVGKLDWESLIPQIGMAQAAVARFDGILQAMVNPELMLFSKGLISRPTFYISEYFEENRPHYYRRLAAISEEQDWQGWSEFFLTAVSEQAELNTRRTGAMLRLYNDMKDEINRVTRSQHALETLDALFASPFMTKSDFVKRTRIATRSAERLLLQLESADIITVAEPGSGSRPTVFVFKRLLAITEQRRGF